MSKKGTLQRSSRAHRRYTKAESRALDEVRRDVDDNGLRSLVEFVNHEGSWDRFWGGGIAKNKIRGEEFQDWNAEELKADLRMQIQNFQNGEQLFPGPVDITLRYRVRTDGLVEATVDGSDLQELLQWFLLEAVRTGRAHRLKLCRQCGRAFLSKRSSAHYCPAPSDCQDRAANARKTKSHARNVRAQRRYAARNFGSRRTA